MIHEISRTDEADFPIQEGTSTVPEKSATLRMQMQWLTEGKRRAVLITTGATLPLIPPDMCVVGTSVGLLIYRPEVIGSLEIRELVGSGRLGELLGYGIAQKPEDGRECGTVVIRNGKGREKQAVVTDAEHLPEVTRRAHQMADPGDRVTLEPCEKVIEDRLRGLVDSLPKLRPLQTEEEVRHLLATMREAGESITLPTHYVEKDGEIVGAIGASSIPLCTLWLHKDKVKPRETLGLLNVIENSYRMNGVQVGAVLVHNASPFGPVMEKLGYQADHNSKIYWRKL